MNHRDREQQQGRRGGREDDHRSDRGQRDTYAPQPRWMQEQGNRDRDEQQRRFSGGRDDEGIGGSQYGGNEYGYGGSGRGSYAGSGEEWGENEQGYGRRGSMTNRDFGGRDYGQRDQQRMRDERDTQQRASSGRNSWDEEEFNDQQHFNENQGRYDQFRVGTGMGVGARVGSDYGREREFGQSYGAASGYGSRAGWDLGTHQRDTGGGAQQQRQSFRGMGPSHYKRSDDRIRDDIYERLTDDHHIDARAIMVDVNEGNVTLSGTVTERRMRYAAEDLVERIGGVANINNQLRVQSDDKPQG